MKTILQKTLVLLGTCLFAGSVFAHYGWRDFSYGRDLFIKNPSDVCIALGRLVIYPGTAVHVPMVNHVRTIRLKTLGPQGRWVCLVQPGHARTVTVTMTGLGQGLGCTTSEGVSMDSAISP